MLNIPDDIHLGKGLLELELPWFAPDAIRWLDKRLTKDMTVLEFGSGGSTPFFARRCKRVTSIETSPDWFDTVKPYLESKNIDNVELIFEAIIDWDTYDVVLIDSPIRSNMTTREEYLKQVIPMKPKLIIVDDFARLKLPDTIPGYTTHKFIDKRWKGEGVQIYDMDE